MRALLKSGILFLVILWILNKGRWFSPSTWAKAVAGWLLEVSKKGNEHQWRSVRSETCRREKGTESPSKERGHLFSSVVIQQVPLSGGQTSRSFLSASGCLLPCCPDAELYSHLERAPLPCLGLFHTYRRARNSLTDLPHGSRAVAGRAVESIQFHNCFFSL